MCVLSGDNETQIVMMVLMKQIWWCCSLAARCCSSSLNLRQRHVTFPHPVQLKFIEEASRVSHSHREREKEQKRRLFYLSFSMALRDELLRSIWHAFTALDVDKSGKVSKSQLKVTLLLLCASLWGSVMEFGRAGNSPTAVNVKNKLYIYETL